MKYHQVRERHFLTYEQGLIWENKIWCDALISVDNMLMIWWWLGERTSVLIVGKKYHDMRNWNKSLIIDVRSVYLKLYESESFHNLHTYIMYIILSSVFLHFSIFFYICLFTNFFLSCIIYIDTFYPFCCFS